MTGGDELDVERFAHATSVVRRIVDVEPHGLLDHEATIWQDAIVFVMAGELEIECVSGARHCFRRGDILSLARLPIRTVRNTAFTRTRLLAIWRRACVEEITG